MARSQATGHRPNTVARRIHPYACILVALLVGCEGESRFVALPDLTGFGAILVDRRDGGPLRAFAVPGDVEAMRVELAGEPTAGGHGDLLLYRRSLDALGLSLIDGAVPLALAEDPSADPLPTPDKALLLTPELSWVDEPVAPFGQRRMRARPCLDATVDEVSLPGAGQARLLVPWGEDQVLVAGSTSAEVLPRLFVVSRSEARQVLFPPMGPSWQGALDDRGDLWLASSTMKTETGTTALTSAVLLVRLDRALNSVAAGHRLETGRREALELTRFTVKGTEAAFLFTTLEDYPLPLAMTWRDGDRALRVLAWPRAEDRLPNVDCEEIGVYRSYLELGAPGELRYLHGQGVIQHWRGAAVERERIDGQSCGGTFLDNTYASGWAVIDPEFPPPPRTQDRRRVYVRDDADWLLIGNAPDVNGLAVTRWQDRVWVSGNAGRIHELTRRRDNTLRECPPLELDPANDRIERLVVRGEQLVAAGPHHPGNPWKVYWLTRR